MEHEAIACSKCRLVPWFAIEEGYETNLKIKEKIKLIVISSISQRWPANLLVGGAMDGVISFIGFACGGGAKRVQ